ncbi:hypothetical protein CCYA_CCYA07G2080 [Cyanidiococcus yangmingshanensis]|nr:hypothetical protein CCYA_CCYA07G2080 [Cyanidiococcus yangmingshanensis]
MATNRKLQAEIDRTLKKVEEGLDLFNDIWDKVYAAQNMAQRDKFEADLKSQIKKLQRLRDQIKVWQADSSIKDKSKIDVARKKIEEKMEAFKVCERETKTKAFSKEGLAQDRADPLEKSKNEVREWVRDCIEKLKVQIEEREADIEATVSNVKKKKVDHVAVDGLRAKIARHQYHIEMLERILRALDNDAVECDEVNEIRESVEYYVDANTEDDFVEDEGIYEALTLDVPVEIQLPHGQKTKEEGENPQEIKPPEADAAERKESETKRKPEDIGRRPRDVPVSTAVATGVVDDSRRRREATDMTKLPSDQETAGASHRDDAHGVGVSSADTTTTGSTGRQRSAGALVASAWANQQQPVAALLSKQTAATTPVMSGEAYSLQIPSGSPSQPLTAKTPSSLASLTPRLPSGFEPAANSLAAAGLNKPGASEFTPFEPSVLPIASAAGGASLRSPHQAKSMESTALLRTGTRSASSSSNTASAMSGLLSGFPMAQPSSQVLDPFKETWTAEQLTSMTSRDINQDGIGMRALDNSLFHGESSSIGADRVNARSLLTVMRQLDEAIHYLSAPSMSGSSLDPSGSIVSKTSTGYPQREQSSYEPRNPFPVHASFPQTPMNALENPEFYERLDIDPLFFIFFFPQRPKHQFLAARELKRQAWRFHKRHLTWFQRHEEPRVATEVYESGSYVYFDSQMWCQRIKQDFVFSYADLEDELPVA